MSRSFRIFGIAALACTTVACGGGDDPDPAVTFAEISQEVVTTTTCGGPFCHGTTAGGFVMGTPSATYAALVDQPASGAECADSGLKRVVPGDPDASLLYLKLAGNPPCGDEMPPGNPLSSDKVDLVRRWIEGGAVEE
jgi:hypothetical protein